MGWSIGYDSNWQRDVGYGVPSKCDHPKCDEDIDRGLGCVCGGDPYGGERGCGLFFCGKHLLMTNRGQLCPKCARYDYKPYKPKPDTKEWINHKMTHPSWQEWRKENKKARQIQQHEKT